MCGTMVNQSASGRERAWTDLCTMSVVPRISTWMPPGLHPLEQMHQMRLICTTLTTTLVPGEMAISEGGQARVTSPSEVVHGYLTRPTASMQPPVVAILDLPLPRNGSKRRH